MPLGWASITTAALATTIVFLFCAVDYLVNGKKWVVEHASISFPRSGWARTLLQILLIVAVLSLLLGFLVLVSKNSGASAVAGGNNLILKLLFVPASLLSVGKLAYYFLRNLLGLKGTRMAMATAATIGIATTYTWLQYPNWLTLNTAALAIAILVLVEVRIADMRTGVLMGSAFLIYDVIHVFLTGAMQKVAGASLASCPLMIYIPNSLALTAKPPIMGLGLGDIVIPGILVLCAMREARALKNIMLYVATPLGYFLGLVCAWYFVMATHKAQPALLYIVPMVFLGYFLAKTASGRKT